MSNMILYVRICRLETESWMTFKLPHAMDSSAVNAYMFHVMPDWEVGNYSFKNPDTYEDEESVQ